MSLDEDREFAERLIARLPADEEELAIALSATREQIENVCAHLHRQRRISLDRSWDAPRHWRLPDVRS